MAAFLEISTWLWIALVFFIFKYIFKYLAWLYYDKDRTLRENVRRAWDYLSKHSYFEIMKGAIARLYARLSNIFQRRIRFLYLFLLFFFINLLSLLFGSYFIGIDSAELRALSDLFPELQLDPIGMTDKVMGLRSLLAFIFQLCILDLYSFLFTISIIWVASRSKSFTLFLMELITDIAILTVFFGIVFQSLYYWLAREISLSLFGSFFLTFGFGVLIYGFYMVINYFEYRDYKTRMLQDPFLPLFCILFLAVVAFPIMLIITLSTSSLRPVFSRTPFIGLLLVPLTPFTVFWLFRTIKMRSWDKLRSIVKFVARTFLILLLFGGILRLGYHYPLFPRLYSAFSSALTSKFVLILIFSSAFPTLGHLIVIASAIIAKVTPKSLQRFINRHLYALSGNEQKVLNQLGNAFGAVGALITAIIKLI